MATPPHVLLCNTISQQCSVVNGHLGVDLKGLEIGKRGYCKKPWFPRPSYQQQALFRISLPCFLAQLMQLLHGPVYPRRRSIAAVM
jgi:hypothetical protein